MLFSSPPFFLFFAIYFALYLVTPARFQLALVIAGSTFFYACWIPSYVWVPYLLIGIAYVGALWIGRTRAAPGAGRRLALAVTALLLPLAIVKYGRFLYQDVLGSPLGASFSLPVIALPLGISFITFTLIAYVVEVHRGSFPVERGLGRLTGLALFFPHLIAGPILRPQQLLPRLALPRSPRRDLAVRATFGIALFSLGLVKKLVIADPLGAAVDPIYAAPHASASAQQYLLAMYAFPIQIYCDFSAYTDMAIGLATLIGVRLPQNFLVPYGAESMTEHWRRWHITLSSWMRDYVYIPLGGNRGAFARQLCNVMLTMGIVGLWHGASFCFVLWGLYNGMLIAFERVADRLRALRPFPELPRSVRVVRTFHLIAAGGILFRAPDLATAARVAAGPFQAPLEPLSAFLYANLTVLVVLGVALATHRFDTQRQLRRAVQHLPPVLYPPLIAAAWILAIVVSSGTSAKFIYFDF